MMLQRRRAGLRRAAFARLRERFGWRAASTALAALWVFFVTVFILWEAYRYTGIYAVLAEWQYDNLGHHLPSLSFILMVALFTSPAVLMLLIRRRIHKGGQAFEETVVAVPASRSARVFVALAGGLAGAALVTFCFAAMLPEVKEPDQIIDIGRAGSLTPREGNVKLKGDVLYDRTSVFAQNLLVTTRGIRFAPMIAAGATANDIYYFVELLPVERKGRGVSRFTQTRKGYLYTDKLPGSIVRLYRYAGYRVRAPYYAPTHTVASSAWRGRMRSGWAIEDRNPTCGGEALRGAIYALLIAVPPE